ncbi:MAG: hypothetical protein VX874_13560 [Pseudomonadota bacterium]|nr:hypothetical protein [Pseudomonadota bacterium]
MKHLLIALALLMAPGHAHAQQTFSCSYGDRAACLGYGDTVCSSQGKCVSQDAACFSSYQCNYEGFTCKSNLTECADEYDGLQSRFNALVDDYNDLLEESHEIRDDFRSTLFDLEDTRDALSNARSELFYVTQQREEDLSALEDLRDCIEDLGQTDDAIDCL